MGVGDEGLTDASDEVVEGVGDEPQPMRMLERVAITSPQYREFNRFAFIDLASIKGNFDDAAPRNDRRRRAIPQGSA